MTKGVVVKEQSWLGSDGIGVAGGMVGVGMVRPVLFHPQPLASTDKISTESQYVVDPVIFRGCSMVRIVLHIQTNESLCHTQNDCHRPTGSLGHPQVLTDNHERNVEECTGKISWSTKLPPSSNDLEDLPLNIPLKLGIKQIVGFPVHNSTDPLHLFEMLGCVVGVDHFVLNRHIVPAKKKNGSTTGMTRGKVFHVINCSVDGNLSISQILQVSLIGIGSSRESGGSVAIRIQDIVIFGVLVTEPIAQTRLISIGCHDSLLIFLQGW
mmetsp:Transcript_17805/g.32234  ORF Transcript_17805/g.32234 Transcript_17805/m.32234 type:complete len:267 (-) Transcript_17805:61-861(-)